MCLCLLTANVDPTEGAQFSDTSVHPPVDSIEMAPNRWQILGFTCFVKALNMTTVYPLRHPVH